MDFKQEIDEAVERLFIYFETKGLPAYDSRDKIRKAIKSLIPAAMKKHQANDGFIEIFSNGVEIRIGPYLPRKVKREE